LARRSINFTPMATFKGMADPAMHRRFVEAHLALLMPRAQYGGRASASVAVTGAAGLLPTEAEEQGKLVITGEFGGGGYIAAERHALILRGVENCLRHLGLLGGAATTREALGEASTVVQSAADPAGLAMGGGVIFMPPCVFCMENR
jgi:predicted deacylase